jgi:DNA-binding transcriptional LysR family regulator
MDLRGFDLNLLLAFEALADTRSVSRAADRLGIGQPAMSAALSRLRRLTGDRLFERTGGRMEPTARAAALIPGIAAGLLQLRTTLAKEVEFDPASASRTFTLASTDYTTALILPRLAAWLKDHGPRIDLRFASYDKQEVPELVARGDVDLAIGVFEPLPPDAVRTKLWSERFVGVARQGHPVLRNLTPETYAAADHALVSVRRDARGRIDQELEALGLRRRIAVVLPHMLALQPVLLASDLVAALPSRMAASFRQSGLKTFELPIASRAWEVEMLWRPSARTDRANRWLRQLVSHAAREVDSDDQGFVTEI